MFKEDQVQIGDALQYRVKGAKDYIGIFINWFSLGNKQHNYAHTAGYYGLGYKVEAHMGSKFGKYIVDKKESKDIDIWRVSGGITVKEKEIFIRVAKRYFGKEYDSIGLVGTTPSTLGKLFNWGWLKNYNPVLNDPDRFFCSEIYNRIYEDMGKEPDWTRSYVIDLAPKIHEEGTQPNDISRGGVLYKVC